MIAPGNLNYINFNTFYSMVMYTLTINFTSKYVDCIEQVSLNLFVLSHNLNFNRCEIPCVIPGWSQ